MLRRTLRASVLWLWMGLVLALSSRARAEEPEAPPRPTIGVYVDGLSSKDVREDLIDRAGKFFQVAPPGDLTAALWKAGFAKGVWRALASEATRKKSIPGFHRAGVLAHTDAVLVATAWTAAGGEQRVVILVLRSSGDDPPVADLEMSFPKEEPREQRAIRMGAALDRPLRALAEQVTPPPEVPEAPTAPEHEPKETPPPAAPQNLPPPEPMLPNTPNTIDALERSLLGGEGTREAPPPPPPPEPPSTGEPSPGIADIRLGFDTGTRLYRHDEATTGEHRVYRAAPIMGYALAAEVHPLRRLPPRFDLALTAEYGHSLGLKSQTRKGGDSYATSTYRYGFRARLGVRTGQKAISPLLGVWGGYAAQSYQFDTTATDSDHSGVAEVLSLADDEVPVADYKMLRVGLYARIPVRLASLLVEASYAGVFAVAPLGARVPAGGAKGFEVLGGIAVPLWKRLELRLIGSYGFFDFHLVSPTGRADAPGHVRDQYTRIGLEGCVTF